jgi:cell division protein FtsQ
MKLWQKIGISIVVLSLVGYLGFSMYTFSTQNTQKICSGLSIRILDENERQFITTKDVEKSLERNKISILKKKISGINTEDIEKAIRKNAVVKKVDCYKSPSGEIKIDIWQREPIMRVMGLYNYYVDAEGVLIPINPNFTTRVPIITGNVNKKFATQELYKFVLFLRNNKFWDAQIEQIQVEPNNDIILIPRVGDQEIILGELNGYEKKLEKLKTFYNNGLNKIGWGDYQSINLKYKNQVVCKKREENKECPQDTLSQ